MTLPRWLARLLEPRLREAEEDVMRAAEDKARFYHFHEQELSDRDRRLEDVRRQLEEERMRGARWRREARSYERRMNAALDRLDALAGTGARAQETAKERAEREGWADAAALVARAVDDMIPRDQAAVYQRTLNWAEGELRRRGVAHAQAIADEVREGHGDRVTVGAAGAGGDDDDE